MQRLCPGQGTAFHPPAGLHLDIFHSILQHVSVEELCLKVKASRPGIGYATFGALV
ncbi:MAG: hypothetical protein HYV06_09990 [Deltaproteobacteria bacterium]|nr:hypothetical protein [Deltaproteobacteria bacterium]